MLETVKTLCALDGVSGTEDSVRAYIKSRVAALSADVRTDAMGNLIVFKKGRKTPSKSLMLCAHMDEVGIIVTGITEDGYLKFDFAGGIDRRVVIGKPVFIGAHKVFGVIGNKAYHLVKRDERDKIPSVEEMYIDIGAKGREEAAKLVSLGDTGAFDGSILEFGNGFIKAKALDDRVGCAALLELLETDLPVDCTFVFTVQEEAGTRGAFGASFSVRPDIALIVEGTTAADLPSVSSAKRVCSLGKGVVIPFMDRSTIYNRELYTLLTSLADKNSIPWQTKTYISGGTDAGAVQRSRAGVMTAGIAAPLRNLHSPSSVGCVSDFDAVYKLAEVFLKEIGERY
ncbi:endoglucanase [Sporobacter termitidis DSM 10068]|uniref:Endoglucanase n=1 Tax=Sporobacter termitidis DSM 10068 TaxID=1123282 RepID=A0A1M5UFE3_9FIRM|nr:M42 family metallopeptidase [Sporobacter termitidis]SHH61754.1 endoglucanase [Sporobacter termitidis DSM 10068]